MSKIGGGGTITAAAVATGLESGVKLSTAGNYHNNRISMEVSHMHTCIHITE